MPNDCSLAELAAEALITTVQVTNIFDLVAHHNEAIEAKSKGKSRVLFGIYATGFKNVRVNHAAGHELAPASLLTD